MIVSCRIQHLQSLIVIWLICSGVAGGGSPLCPTSCTCKQDKGKRRISCLAGGMSDSLPVGQMDPQTEILEISAPDDRKNWLSVTSIFQRFKQLEELHIGRSNVQQIAMHAFWGIPSLKVLDLSANNVSAVFDHNFRGLVNLIELNLADNRIATLPSGAFKHLTDLRTLNLQRNKLTVLVARTFLKLVKLRVLRLSGNQFEELDPEAFKEIPELRTLECRNCGLRRINTQLYHLLPYLTHLDLGHNLIQYLYYDEFQDLHRLHTLKLDGNMFPVILENTFVHQQQLKHLNLAGNRIAKLPNTALANLTSLLELDLGHNKLYKVEQLAFTHVASTLQKLTLSGNNLKMEGVKLVLDTVVHVVELGIAHLKLQKLYKGFLPDRITSLDLSGNNLTLLDTALLPRQLKRLDLSHNNLTSLKGIAVLERLEYVNLAGNPWRCDQCISNLLHSPLSRNISCAFPTSLHGQPLTQLSVEELPLCGELREQSPENPSRGLFIGLLCILSFGFFSVVFVVYSCVKRHQNQALQREKRTAESSENHQYPPSKSDITFQFPLDLMAVSTIDDMKKDRMVNGSVVTGL